VSCTPGRNRENLARGIAFLTRHPIIRLDGKGNNKETKMVSRKSLSQIRAEHLAKVRKKAHQDRIADRKAVSEMNKQQRRKSK
jgi:hypothetical protein